MSKTANPTRRVAWGILFSSDNVLDGHREYLGGGARFNRHEAFCGYTTMAFATRAAARRFIADHYSYFARSDLKAEPHGWKMPRPVRVSLAVTLAEAA